MFVYNGDFTNGKRHGHGEMYWCPIDFSKFENVEKPDEIQEMNIFKKSQFEFHYSGEWQNDKMNGKGDLYVRKQIINYYHNIYKISGKWINNKLDTKIDDITKMVRYYIILVDEELKPIKNQGTQSNIKNEINIDELDNILRI